MVPIESSGPIQVYFLLDTTDEDGRWKAILNQIDMFIERRRGDSTKYKVILIGRYPYRELEFPFLKDYFKLLNEPTTCYLSSAFQKLEASLKISPNIVFPWNVTVFTILFNNPGGKGGWMQYFDKFAKQPNILLNFIHIAGKSKIQQEFVDYVLHKQSVTFKQLESPQFLEYLASVIYPGVKGNRVMTNPSTGRSAPETPSIPPAMSVGQRIPPEQKRADTPAKTRETSPDDTTQASNILQGHSPEHTATPLTQTPRGQSPEPPPVNQSIPPRRVQAPPEGEKPELKQTSTDETKETGAEEKSMPPAEKPLPEGKLPQQLPPGEKKADQVDLVIELPPPVVGKDGVAAIWQNLEPDESLGDRVPNELKQSMPAGNEWTMLAASRRGKMHAHKGSFREDAFALGEANGWQFIVVADGGGSRDLARVGANLATQTAVEKMIQTANEFSKVSQLSAQDVGELILKRAVQAAYEALKAEASRRNLKTDDFGTTYLALAMRPDPKDFLVGVLQVGDGMIAALLENQEVKILAEPDVGESASQTLFLTSKPVEEWLKRIHFSRLPAPPVMVANMCDGVSDDLIPYARNLPVLFKELMKLTEEDTPEEALLKFLGYERRGSFDDRTLALTFHKQSVKQLLKKTREQVVVENKANRQSSPFTADNAPTPGTEGEAGNP